MNDRLARCNAVETRTDECLARQRAAFDRGRRLQCRHRLGVAHDLKPRTCRQQV
jgi:hypothetical protein